MRWPTRRDVASAPSSWVRVFPRARTFLYPTADEAWGVRVLEQLLDGLRWQANAVSLAVSLEQIQDAVVEQLSLNPSRAEMCPG